MYRIKWQDLSTSLTLLCASVAWHGCRKGRRGKRAFWSLVPPGSRWTAVSHSSECVRACVQNYWPRCSKSLSLLLQSFFCTFSWFFWNFWWTTFKVVRKFPRNKTRNVRASMKTCKDTFIKGATPAFRRYNLISLFRRSRCINSL